MTGKANKVACFLFALFTGGTLLLTFYFPLIGIGYAIDPSADLQSRGLGLLLLLPSVAGVVLLLGMFPALEGRRLFWLGIGGSLLLLPSLAACAWLGAAWIVGSFVGLTHLAAWWLLAGPRITLATTNHDRVGSTDGDTPGVRLRASAQVGEG